MARFEAGADTRMSTVAHYAAALGVTVRLSIESPTPSKRPDRRMPRRVPVA